LRKPPFLPESTKDRAALLAQVGRQGGNAFMATNFLTQIFGSRNDRLLRQYRKTVERINAMEPALEKLSDDELRGKTEEFKRRVANGETLDAVLPEAFAVVREGSKRVMKMRHFDVQLLGGMSLHNGKISEMRTGRGQDAHGHAAGLPECVDGQGRARRHRERLPGQPRRAVDGPAVQLPGPDGGREPAQHAPRGKAGRLPR
jgi:hypothetical protein